MAPIAVLQNTVSIPSAYTSIVPVRATSNTVDLSSPPRRAPKERTPPPRTAFAFDTVESAVAAVARGEFVVVMDDEGRENEGDLIIPAVGCSTEQMAWMIKHTRCVLPATNSALAGFYTPTITQRIHLFSTAKRSPRGVIHPDDGPTKRRAAPDGLHRHGRL